MSPAGARRVQVRGQQSFGTWSLKKKIGRGGHGEVWLAVNDKGQQAALKVLTKVRPTAYLRFKEEVAVLGQISDIEGILPILDAYLPERRSADDLAWYVMPLAKPLWSMPGRSDASKVVATFARLASILAALHERGISHRDIKPANLLLHGDQACISDFGLVQHASRTKDLTKKGEAVGSKWTMAPEMRRDPTRASGPPADIYSLAKTLWMFLTDEELGFEGQYVSGDSSVSISKHVPIEFPEPLEAVLAACTDNDPAKRWPAPQVASALKVWVEQSKDFQERNRLQWAALLNGLFPSGVPESAVWQDISQIIRILNLVGRITSLNHTLFPDGGGLDLTSARLGRESSTLELDFDGVVALVQPKSLRFERIGQDLKWSCFLLETEQRSPSGVYGALGLDQRREVLVELSPLEYCRGDFWDVQEFRRSQLPRDARLISRYTRGSFLIVQKAGPINRIPETYQGVHEKFGGPAFFSAIRKIVEEIESGEGSPKPSPRLPLTAHSDPIPKVVTFNENESPFSAISISTIRKIIDLAKKRNKESKAIYKRYARQKTATGGSGVMTLKDLHALSLLEKGKYEKYEKALTDALKQLAKGELSELLALMWFGRDLLPSRTNWINIKDHARRDTDADTVQYIREKAPLHEYLADGLERLGLKKKARHTH